jgi:hypothetical protein
LPSKHEALSSNPGSAKKKEKEKRNTPNIPKDEGAVSTTCFMKLWFLREQDMVQGRRTE